MIAMIWLNLGTCCFNVHTVSFEQPSMNFIEVFNEGGNLIISVFLYNMSKVSDGEQLYAYGLIVNYYIIFMFLFNVCFIMT